MVTLGGMIGDLALEQRIDDCDWSEACVTFAAVLKMTLIGFECHG